MTNDQILIEELKAHEGWRRQPYRDTVGKLSIGCGRNLDDVGISDAEIQYLLASDILRAKAGLDRIAPWWKTLSAGRQRVLINMCFNLGADKLAGFRNTLAAIKAGDYVKAAAEMLDSRWATQVGSRATYLANIMRIGDYTPKA